MPIIQITPPSEEPITLAEAKLHLRIDADPTASPVATHPDDSLVANLIKAARRWCEHFQNRTYVTQTWDLMLDAFPEADYIEIPRPPLESITSLSYKDGSGTLQVISFLDPSGNQLSETTEYKIDIASDPGKLWLKNGVSWPTTFEEAQAVQIRFVCGYGSASDVPDDVKAAILLKLADLYENRGDSEPGSRYEEAVKSILRQEKIYPI